jgi:hypothetical protein
MGITLSQLQKRLVGELDIIPPSLAKDLINDALRDIYDEVEWGFLFTDSFIRTPAVIDGYANVIKFSDLITLDSATKALVDSITPDDPQLDERQIRFLGTSKIDRGFLYRILDYDSVTGELRIDPPFQDDDNLNRKLQIVKVFYTAPYYVTTSMGVDPITGEPVVIKSDPVIDFKRFEYIVSPEYNRRLIIDVTPAELYKKDPYREFVSEPRYLSPYSVDSLGNQLFEIYPAPRSERVLRVKYLRAGLPLNNPEDQAPDLFSKELLVSKATIKAYKWAYANADKLKLKSPGRFQNLIAIQVPIYQDLLMKAQKKDEELYPKAYQGNVLDYPYYDYDEYFLGECMGETLILNF